MLHSKAEGSGTRSVERPHILVGVTSPQTCLVLPDRLRALRDAGFRVSLLSAPGELLDQTGKIGGAECYAVRMERGISPLTDFIALVRIWRLLRRLRPDVVEFSTPKAGLLGSLAARLCGIPVRIYMLRGLKLETSLGLRRRLLLWTERVASESAHIVLCNSQSLRERVLECGIAPESKLFVVGAGSSNGVDIRRFSPGPSCIRQQLGIGPDTPVIGFVGRFTTDKGVPELLEAFTALLHREPSAYLLLVGWFDAAEDALDLRVRERIEGHPRMILTGFVHDPAPYYRAMDVMVLPSWREGFPNVILEAAASGVPVVATSCTGSRDAVVSGVTGLLIPPGEPDAISSAVLSLLRDPDCHRRMSKAARAWVAENYENRTVLGLTVALYTSLVNSTVRQVVTGARSIPESATGLSVLP